MAHGSKHLSIPKQTLKRLPSYYEYLKLLQNNGEELITSPVIAKDLRLNEVQVRKDFAYVSKNGGKPRTGFNVEELIYSIEAHLGYNNLNEAVLVGVGRLGSAILDYDGFSQYGFRIVAAFDKNHLDIAEKFPDKNIFSMDKLTNLCQRLKVRIGIIAVPVGEAQNVCDLLIDSDIQAILNFAPIHLMVPEHILVKNENMAISLTLLSHQLEDNFQQDDANNIEILEG